MVVRSSAGKREPFWEERSGERVSWGTTFGGPCHLPGVLSRHKGPPGTRPGRDALPVRSAGRGRPSELWLATSRPRRDASPVRSAASPEVTGLAAHFTDEGGGPGSAGRMARGKGGGGRCHTAPGRCVIPRASRAPPRVGGSGRGRHFMG